MKRARPPILFVLSGPSGAGKDTVIAALQASHPDLHYAITATTRAQRPGEIDGVSYYFLSKPQYDELADRGQLLAPANVHGHWYGAPLTPIQEALSDGHDVLLKIDVQGAMQVRRRLPQSVYIFLTTPSFEDLVSRLELRHTEDKEDLQRRIQDAHFEMAQMPQYDYCVVNEQDDLNAAVDGVSCIIMAERLRIHRQPISLESR
jgi:guanylate kinase